jgi:hypothetical protein
MLNRDALAAFLRSKRARLRPSDVGLPDGLRRRTPGLRRQVLHIPDTDQRLIVYCAAPGSPTAEAFVRLAAATTRS